MELNKLVQRVNDLLAGETLTFEDLQIHFDAVIDDINSRLNSTFPALSEFHEDKDYYPDYPDYDFFPDKHIRSVLAIGAAYYFYMTDEEGIEAAVDYARTYNQNLFYMERDYSMGVPEEFQAEDQGSLHTPEPQGLPAYIDDMF